MNTQRGFIGIGMLIAILLGLAVIGGGAYYVTHQQPAQQTPTDNFDNTQTLPTNIQSPQTQTTTNTPIQTTPAPTSNSSPATTQSTTPVASKPSLSIVSHTGLSITVRYASFPKNAELRAYYQQAVGEPALKKTLTDSSATITLELPSGSQSGQYYLVAVNSNGSAVEATDASGNVYPVSAWVTISSTNQVAGVKPTCSVSANKTQARPGEPITFTWTSTNADYASTYSPDYKPVSQSDRLPANGSYTYATVDPNYLDSNFAGPFTFTRFVVGSGGSASCNLTVPVAGSTQNIAAYPDTIALAAGATAVGNDLTLTVNSLTSAAAQITAIVSGVAKSSSINLQQNPSSFMFENAGNTFYVNYCGVINKQYLLLTVGKDKPLACPSNVG
ncbi:MAG: hypothetical protein K9M10_04165 [Candidatus Pacebacteria bacterium]|nr:hypothetical protein [Candidatus Paceibacterota bacterium]MCF7857639.1 hypothetical protein [Candidatus Paceibacterota bacterium]